MTRGTRPPRREILPRARLGRRDALARARRRIHRSRTLALITTICRDRAAAADSIRSARRACAPADRCDGPSSGYGGEIALPAARTRPALVSCLTNALPPLTDPRRRRLCMVTIHAVVDRVAVVLASQHSSAGRWQLLVLACQQLVAAPAFRRTCRWTCMRAVASSARGGDVCRASSR